MSISTLAPIATTPTIPPSVFSDRQRYLQTLTSVECAARLGQVVRRFEAARSAFEASPDPDEHRQRAATCETIAQDVLETACAFLGGMVFQSILDAAYVVEEGLFDHDDERYLM